MVKRTEPIPNRTLSKIKVDHLLWSLDYDLTERRLYVYFADGDPTEQRDSADGNYIADIRYDSDGIPVLLGLTICDPIRVGVIEDWIHEGAELALAEFGDDFVKGTMQVWQDADGSTYVTTPTY